MTMMIPTTTGRGPQKVRAANLTLLSTISVAAVLGIWSAASVAGLLSPGVCPPPWDIVKAGYRLATEGFAGSTLQMHLLSSFRPLCSGIPVSGNHRHSARIGDGWSAPIRYVVAPFFETFRFIAPLAWIPFAALWFGTGIGGPILIVFSGAFAPCVINAFRGAQQIDPVLLESSRTLGASRWRLTVDVLLPGALPSIMAGLRISAALAWQSLVGAELIVASSGVGYMMVQGQGSFETSIVLAGMVSIGIVGLIIDRILQFASDRIGHKWRQTAL